MFFLNFHIYFIYFYKSWWRPTRGGRRWKCLRFPERENHFIISIISQELAQNLANDLCAISTEEKCCENLLLLEFFPSRKRYIFSIFQIWVSESVNVLTLGKCGNNAWSAFRFLVNTRTCCVFVHSVFFRSSGVCFCQGSLI